MPSLILEDHPALTSAESTSQVLPSAIWSRLSGISMTSGKMRTLVSLVDQAAFAVTTFGTGVVIGRTLLEEEFSVYYLAMTMIIVMRNLQSELVSAPYAVYRQRVSPSERSQYAGSVVAHQLLLSFTGLAPVALMLAAAMAHWVSPRMIPTLSVMLLVTPLLLFRSFLRSFSFASYRFLAAVAIDVSVGVMQLLGLVCLYFTGALTVASCYGVMGLACVVGILVWRRSEPEALQFDPRRYWSDWRNNWKFSRWALSSQLLGTTAPYVVPWLLEAYHGSSATGVYGACFTILGLSMHFVTAVANYLTPRAAAAFAEDGPRGLSRVLFKSAMLYLIVIGGVCLGAWLLGDWPVRWVYGPSYADTATTCLLLAGFTLAISLSVVAGNGLWAMNRPDANLWADAATMAATLGAACWLIPAGGRDGAAGAMLIGAAAGAVVRIWSLHANLHHARRGDCVTGIGEDH